MTNRQWRLAARPRGMLKESDLVLHETPVPEPTEGEYLVRMRFLIVHPEARLALSRAEVGNLLNGYAVGKVMKEVASPR